jgi:hypothetical protein
MLYKTDERGTIFEENMKQTIRSNKFAVAAAASVAADRRMQSISRSLLISEKILKAIRREPRLPDEPLEVGEKCTSMSAVRCCCCENRDPLLLSPLARLICIHQVLGSAAGLTSAEEWVRLLRDSLLDMVRDGTGQAVMWQECAVPDVMEAA